MLRLAFLGLESMDKDLVNHSTNLIQNKYAVEMKTQETSRLTPQLKVVWMIIQWITVKCTTMFFPYQITSWGGVTPYKQFGWLQVKLKSKKERHTNSGSESQQLYPRMLAFKSSLWALYIAIHLFVLEHFVVRTSISQQMHYNH